MCVDLLGSRFDGSSASRPFVVEASDGTPVRRIDFGPPSVQQVSTTDVALFAQRGERVEQCRPRGDEDVSVARRAHWLPSTRAAPSLRWGCDPDR